MGDKEKKTAHYVAYFDTQIYNDESRVYFPTAVAPIRYMTDAIKRSGYQVNCISLGATKLKNKCKGHIYEVDSTERIIVFPCLGRRSLFSRILRRAQMNYYLGKHLLFHVKKDEPVIVYHTRCIEKTIAFCKSIRRFKLVLEVGEIYSDVSGTPEERVQELNYLRQADSYIFFTQLLEEEVNEKNKRFCIVHGTYNVELQRSECILTCDPDHLRRHLLYAGTLHPRKGCAIAAAAAAYLPSNYHIHILGFGSDEDKRLLQETIDRASAPNRATVTMDGHLSGEEYIRFVQSCDVGLNTQYSDASFNNSSFPSKVTSYLSNGLRVVSVRLPALERSALSNSLHYYDGNDPRNVATAVKCINWDMPYDSRSVIRELDASFVKELGELLNA